MSGKKLLIFVGILLLLLAVPLSLYFYTQQQATKPHSIATTKLEFSPATGIKKVDDVTEFKIKIDPGESAVSFVSLDISYDASKFDAPSNALTIDKTVMPLILQGPVYTDGRIRVNLSTGNDPSAALSKAAILGSLKLRAISSTNGETTSVSFGSGTQVLSVSASNDANDQSGQNILASTTPAQIMIADPQPHELIAAGSPAPDQPTPVDSTAPSNQTAAQPATVATPSPTEAATEATTAEATATPTPIPQSPTPTLKPATPTPTKMATPTPTTVKAVAGISDAPTETPTVTPDTTTTSIGSPTPTIDATGPGSIYIGLGAFFFILLIGGGILVFLL